MVISRLVCHVQLYKFILSDVELLDFQGNDGIYRPPKIQPVSMDDKRSKDDSRRQKALARMATENPYLKEMIDDAADRPEEVCILFCLDS